MKCKLTFEINGEEISLDFESSPDSPLINQDIIEVLKQNEDQRKAICDLIHDRLYKYSKQSNITLKDIPSIKCTITNLLRSILTEI